MAGRDNRTRHTTAADSGNVLQIEFRFAALAVFAVTAAAFGFDDPLRSVLKQDRLVGKRIR